MLNIEDWIDEAYIHHPNAPIPRQTNLHWKRSLEEYTHINIFTYIQSHNTPYERPINAT